MRLKFQRHIIVAGESNDNNFLKKKEFAFKKQKKKIKMQQRPVLQRPVLHNWEYKTCTASQKCTLFLLEMVCLTALSNRTPMFVFCCCIFGIITLHMMQMIYVPRYRKKMRTVARFGIIPVSNRCLAVLNFLKDTNFISMLIYPLCAILPWDQVVMIYFFTTIVCEKYAFITKPVNIVHLMHDQRFAPLLDLQDWFQRHVTYDASIHAVLDPLIQELYSVSTFYPLDVKCDQLYFILQPISDWVLAEENKHTKDKLKQLFPTDIVNVVLKFANIPLGNNEQRKKYIIEDIDSLVLVQRECLWERARL